MTQATEPATILVVEDEALIRMSTTATLEDAGFRVIEAQDSAEALEMLSQHREISVVVTDVKMPGRMDGLGLVAQLRCDYPAIRSIVVSGNASALEASKAGATGFLSKPYMAQSMVRAVVDTITRHLSNPVFA